MQVFIIVYASVLLFISLLIIASILLQEDKSGGGIGVLGGSSQSFFGASSGSILSKFTSILLVIFLVSGIVIAILSSRFSSESTISETDITKSEYEARKVLIDTRTDFQNKDQTEDVKK